ncbi:fimbria/pilus outer membrane usher protein [Shewanella youngdeokensis]|uniref:Fimbria/pilus outer membrane usher protein n=1 Tax=Shewanella youngdeokensis TaxID=2999068 RepID=A0ABZ0K1B4_9GAMM|nr:fimbria/pilus outer membrane usher protein [Shewanella sp. DAU334]
MKAWSLLLLTAVAIGKPVIVTASEFDAEQAIESELDFSFVETHGGAIATHLFQKTEDIYSSAKPLAINISQQDYGVRVVRAWEVDGLPCIGLSVFSGVQLSEPFLNKYVNNTFQCLMLDPDIGASYSLNSSLQALSISLPQTSFSQYSNQSTNWDFGDNGINIQYQVYGTESNNDDANYYASVNTKINFSRWRLEVDAYSTQSRSDINRLIARRDLPKMGAILEVGNTFLSSSHLDPFSFDGVSLKSDWSLTPEINQSYAPIIRGVAKSNARIELHQSDRLIFSDVVGTGPFEYSDYGVISNGDLILTVIEESGEEITTVYPVSTLPEIIPIGSSEFQFSIGVNENIEKGGFMYADYHSGFERFTASMGGLLGQDYQNLGLGISSDLGAYGAIGVTFDASLADGDSAEIDRSSGWRYAINYSKALTENTNMSLVGIDYRSKGYRSFGQNEIVNLDLSTIKNDISLNLNHRFPRGIYLAVSGYSQDYWSKDRRRGVTVQCSTSLSNVAISMNGNFSQFNEQDEYQITLGFSVPLGGISSPYTYSSVSRTKSTTTYSTSLSGNIDERSSYGVSWSDSSNANSSTYLNVNRQFDHVNGSANLSYTQGDVAGSVSLSGSILKVGGSEFVLSSQHYDSALVVDMDEPGVKFKYGTMESDDDGMLVTSLSAYSHNERYLNSQSLAVGSVVRDLRYNISPTTNGLFYRKNEVTHMSPQVLVLTSNIDIPQGSAIRDEVQMLGTIGADNMIMLNLNADAVYQLSVFDGEQLICQLPPLSTEPFNRTQKTVPVRYIQCE